jgi:hypothetical protein
VQHQGSKAEKERTPAGRETMRELNSIPNSNNNPILQPQPESDEYLPIVIRDNNMAGPFCCFYCKATINVSTGPRLFIEGTREVVCDECGAKYAPELMAMVEDAQRERLAIERGDVMGFYDERRAHYERLTQGEGRKQPAPAWHPGEHELAIATTSLHNLIGSISAIAEGIPNPQMRTYIEHLCTAAYSNIALINNLEAHDDIPY